MSRQAVKFRLPFRVEIQRTDQHHQCIRGNLGQHILDMAVSFGFNPAVDPFGRRRQVDVECFGGEVIGKRLQILAFHLEAVVDPDRVCDFNPRGCRL